MLQVEGARFPRQHAYSRVVIVKRDDISGREAQLYCGRAAAPVSVATHRNEPSGRCCRTWPAGHCAMHLPFGPSSSPGLHGFEGAGGPQKILPSGFC
jgi:hypothetical protein